MTQHVEDFFEDRARAGDAGFAVAFAIMQLSRQQERTANALNRLGLADAATPMGAIELLSKQLGDTGRDVAAAIGELRQD